MASFRDQTRRALMTSLATLSLGAATQVSATSVGSRAKRAGAPILVGTLMLGFGVWRRMKGKTTTSLATCWGGAAFAFGIALARFLLAS